MKPAPFEYHRAADVDDAVAVLQATEDGKAIAGGQSLIAMMNLRLARPSLLVDLNPLRDLDYIERRPDGSLAIGAMTRQRSLERSALVQTLCPVMSEALPHIGHPVIRNRGTIGGSLAHADSGSELCGATLAADAVIRTRGPNGDRDIAAEQFFDGPFTTVLSPSEILTEVVIPAAPPRSGYAFAEVARRRGDFALAGVAAIVGLDDSGAITHARLSYISLGPNAVRARHAEEFLIGLRPEDAAIMRATALVSHDITPADSLHATADFKLHLATVLTDRVLRRAIGKAAS